MTCNEKGCPYPVEREGALCARHGRMFEKEQWMLTRTRPKHVARRARPTVSILPQLLHRAKRKPSPHIARIVELICTEGLSNAEIAERLELTEATAKFYVAQAISNMGAPSRSKMIVGYWKSQLNAVAS